MISNLKTQRSRPENASIRKILTLGCFVKKLLLWFTISSKSYVFPYDFYVCFEKVPCMTLYSEKIGVWNSSQTMWDSSQTSALMLKNLSFIVFATLACIYMHARVCICMHEAYVCRFGACVLIRMPKGFRGLCFPKIVLFSL